MIKKATPPPQGLLPTGLLSHLAKPQSVASGSGCSPSLSFMGQRLCHYMSKNSPPLLWFLGGGKIEQTKLPATSANV